MITKSAQKTLKSTWRIALCSLAVTVLAATGLAQTTIAPVQATASPSGGYEVVEARLGRFDWENGEGNSNFHGFLLPTSLPVVSADGRHVLYSYVAKTGCATPGSCLILDGQPISLEKGVTALNGALALSAEGQHVAYAADDNGTYWMVIDGHAGPKHNDHGFLALPSGLTFSPDGKRLAYTTANDDPRHYKRLAVVDGESSPEYDQVLNLNFSPNSKRVAFAAKTGKQWTVVVDGHPGASYDEVYGPIFSPDSDSVAFAAREEKKWFVVVNGKAGPEYEGMVENGAGLAKLADIRYGALAFSPDSKHLAYAAKRGGKWVMVVDGQEGEGYNQVASPVFSFDGKRVAYSAGRYLSKESGWRVVVDGQEGPLFFETFPAVFSPDGKHLAYGAKKAQWAVVVDGKVISAPGELGNWALSPDGNHLAYATKTRQGFSLAGPFGGGGWSVFLDGKPGSEFTVIIPGTLHFGIDGALEFLAAREESHSGLGTEKHGALYRVKYTLTP